MKKLFILLLMAAAMFCACDNSSDSPAATVPPVPAPASTPFIMDITVECANVTTPPCPVNSMDDAVLKVTIKDADKDAAKAYITITWHNPSDGSGVPVEVLNEEAAIPAMAAEEEIFEYTISELYLLLGQGGVDGNYTVEVEIEDAASNMSSPVAIDYTVTSIYS